MTREGFREAVPAEIDERKSSTNGRKDFPASSPSVCSAASSVNPAPTSNASWRRRS